MIEEDTQYVVQHEDTLAGIALRHSMKISDLKYLNHIFGERSIYEGQVLHLKPRFRKKRSHSITISDTNYFDFPGLSGEIMNALPELHSCLSPTRRQTNGSPQNVIDHYLTRSANAATGLFGVLEEPNLIGGSSSEILVDNTYHTMVSLIEGELARHNKGYDWKLLYSLVQHGASLSTLYRKTIQHSPTLILVETDGGEILGGFASQPWKCNQNTYYGNGESFIFHMLNGNFTAYHWTRKNSMFMFSNQESLAMGGGGGFGFFLDADMSKGTSSSCDTFGNECLTSHEDFDIVSVEVWGFVTKR